MKRKTNTSVFWKRELFPEKGFVFIFPETSLTLQKIPVFCNQDVKMQDFGELSTHRISFCIFCQMYLSWMCYLLPKEGRGSETTRDIMN